MEEYIEDLFKIYNSAIDSYNAKILQTINDKYTIIDKSMLATYLYIRILSKLDIEERKAKEVLKNYLLKQIIYGETGNLALDISDKSIEKTYKEVVEKLIIDKFEYKNKIISKLKYNYTILEQNEYTELIDFCENISEYCIIERIIELGNIRAKEVLKSKKEILENKIDEYKKENNKINNEKVYILQQICNNKFNKTEYSDLLEVVLNLRDVYRYSTLTTTIPENVLFHQYTITVVSVIFAEYLNKELNENYDIELLMEKALCHDFGEYKGNEIVAQVKYYNEETKKMFAQIEEADEKELKSKVGEKIYKLITTGTDGKEGYIWNLIDKILGIGKIWVEVRYMHNYTYIKAIYSVYQERFKRFKKIDQLDDIKDKEFLMNFLRNSYIYIKKNLVEHDPIMVRKYFTENDIKDIKEELKLITEQPKTFLA